MLLAVTPRLGIFYVAALTVAGGCAKGIAFAIERPAEVDVGSIVIRPTAQD